MTVTATSRPGVLSARVDGEPREVLEHLPSGPTDGAALVLDLHGLTLTPAFQRDATALRDAADAQGWVVRWPSAGGALRAWDERVDAALLQALVDDAVTRHGVDPTRVVVVGFSAGGFAASTIAGVLSPPPAGIVPIAAGVLGAAPAGGVAVHAVATLDDPVVPHDATVALATAWAAANGCDPTPTPPVPAADGPPDAPVTSRWSGCAPGADVALTTVPTGGHRVPRTDVDLPGIIATLLAAA